MDTSHPKIQTTQPRSLTSRLKFNDAPFREGFLALIPLWPGIGAFGIAFAITARASGFSPIEIQVMSMVLFAGAAQIITVALVDEGAGFLAIVLTVLVLNLRHVLYGLSLSRWLPLRATAGKPVLAYFLTDEAYGIAMKRFIDKGRGDTSFYLGVAVSLYAVYISSTFVGVVAGSLIPNLESLGLDFIFPLTFIALLVPLLRTSRELRVAALAGITALLLAQIATSGLVILLATVMAATAGAALDRREDSA